MTVSLFQCNSGRRAKMDDLARLPWQRGEGRKEKKIVTNADACVCFFDCNEIKVSCAFPKITQL